jgi:hypothetical protein
MRERYSRRGLLHSLQYFMVKKIEVFKIAYQKGLRADREKWVIGVCSKRWSETQPVFDAADLTNTSNYFQSKNESNQWLCYDFKNRKVRRTHYSIHPHSNNLYLRSWIVEGLLDGSNWSVLDRCVNNDEMTSAHPIGIFTVSQSNESRFLRLRQIGNNARGDDYLILYALEFFGKLIE